MFEQNIEESLVQFQLRNKCLQLVLLVKLVLLPDWQGSVKYCYFVAF